LSRSKGSSLLWRLCWSRNDLFPLQLYDDYPKATRIRPAISLPSSVSPRKTKARIAICGIIRLLMMLDSTADNVRSV